MERLLSMALAVAVLLTGAPSFANDGGDVQLPVDATMDIYRAGGYEDGSDGVAPTVYSFAARDGQYLTFSAVVGSWSCTGSVPEYGPDGILNGDGCVPPGGANMADVGSFAGYYSTDFSGALVGMFLEDTLPSSPPPSLRFYDTDSSDGGIPTDFKVLSPRIGQVFFIGDGLTGTGSGAIQLFRVPPKATHLYLGYIDSCSGTVVPSCYSDNRGRLSAVFRIQTP